MTMHIAISVSYVAILKHGYVYELFVYILAYIHQIVYTLNVCLIFINSSTSVPNTSVGCILFIKT